jgi:chitinase
MLLQFAAFSALTLLAQTCNQWDNSVFPGTKLADCSFMASDIKTCQQNGKVITLSLGGATGSVGFSSDSQAKSFAKQIWDMFLGQSPFYSRVSFGKINTLSV